MTQTNQFWPQPKKVPVYRQEGLDWFVYIPDAGYGPARRAYITLAALKKDYPKARPSRLGKDPLAAGYKSADPKIRAAYQKRQQVHRHNSFFGGTRHAIVTMEAIINSSTATSESVQLAQWIQASLQKLEQSLKTRKGQA